MSDAAIKVEHVSKEYRLGMIGGTTLRADLQRLWAKMRGKEDPWSMIGSDQSHIGERFLALDDISFEVKKGEALGIIGHNGAGKSTLLKLLARVTGPTKGKILYDGRIASMLEVGTGFHPELTGRENVYMNGAILGMTRREIDKKFDEIVDFAEMSQFIDTPVKRYSSGMYVKLAFSVAAHLDAEIMIMDEVLAVGDMKFQQKCLGRMNDAAHNEGRTVLFVSHNMPFIKRLCNKGVVLNHGKIIYSGTADESVEHYLKKIGEKTSHDFDMKRDIEYYVKDFTIHKILVNGEFPRTVDLDNNPTLKVQFECTSKYNYSIEVIVRILDSNETLIASYSSISSCGKVYKAADGKYNMCEEINLPPNLSNSEYYLQIHIAQRNINYLAKIPILCRLIKRELISAYSDENYNPKNSGYIIL